MKITRMSCVLLPMFLLMGTSSVSAGINADWDYTNLVIEITGSSSETVWVKNSGSNVRIENGSGQSIPIHVQGVPVTVPLNGVEKLIVKGGPAADFVYCVYATAANGWSLKFCDIYGNGGNDLLVGTGFRDRFFGGSGNDTIMGESGDDYVIDYNQQGDTDTVFSAKGLSQIWNWQSGDITMADWNNFIDPANPNTNFEISPTIGEIISKANNSTVTIPFGPSDDRIQVPINYQSPKMLADGTITTQIFSQSNSGDAHNMFRVWDPSLEDKIYFADNKRYRIEMTAYFFGSFSNVSWAVPLQLHPGTFPSGFAGGQPTAPSKNPPIALYIDGDQPNGAPAKWWMAVRGSTNATPLSFDPTYDRYATFTGGLKHIVLEFTIDYTGVNSYTNISIEDAVIGETDATNSINHSGLGAGVNKMQVTQGTYSYDAAAAPQIWFLDTAVYSE